MKWTEYPSRKVFQERSRPGDGGVQREGPEWSDAPGPGAKWCISYDDQGRRKFAWVRHYRGERYVIAGEQPK